MGSTLGADHGNYIGDVGPFNALQTTEYLALSSLFLLCYEYVVTFDREVELYWSGTWTISRILFFINRYFTALPVLLTAIGVIASGLSTQYCIGTIQAGTVMTIFSITIVQAIIVLRLWYIYTNNLSGRIFIVACYAASSISTCVVLGTVWHELHAVQTLPTGYRHGGCDIPPAAHLWHIFMPSLVIHTILYGATTFSALRARHMGRTSPVMDRIFRDDGLVYLVIFVSVGFTGITAAQYNPFISWPAIYSNFELTITSIAVSRLLFSLQDLAANLSVDVEWLLSNAELSRVRWRKGTRNGELIVEIDAVEVPDADKIELGHLRPTSTLTGSDDHANVTMGRTPGIHMTRVGVYSEMGNSWTEGHR